MTEDGNEYENHIVQNFASFCIGTGDRAIDAIPVTGPATEGAGFWLRGPFNVVNDNVATGMLTVRGKTHEEKVTDILITENGDMVTASGNLVFDRQKYGVAWSSGAKDMVLNDNIELSIEMSGKAAM